MSTHRDDDPYSADDEGDDPASSDRAMASHRARVARGIVIALACDAALRGPWTLLRGSVRPDNIVAAITSLLLAAHMLVGYVGGRAATRAGLPYADSRAQWAMAVAVAVLSRVTEIGIIRGSLALHLSQAAAMRALQGAPVVFLLEFVVAVVLVRFGFAMGTYSQAKRDGLVEEEDEASAD